MTTRLSLRDIMIDYCTNHVYGGERHPLLKLLINHPSRYSHKQYSEGSPYAYQCDQVIDTCTGDVIHIHLSFDREDRDDNVLSATNLCNKWNEDDHLYIQEIYWFGL